MTQKSHKPKHAFTTVLLFTLLSLLGIIGLPALNLHLYPSGNSTSLTISFFWNDTPPELLEREVTSKIESVVNTIKGIQKIKSTSYSGYGQINLILDKHSDIDQLRLDVSILIRSIFPELPVGVSYPRITTNKSSTKSDIPILTYILQGNNNTDRLEQYAEDVIRKQLTKTESIQEIRILGGQTQSIKINCSIRTMEVLGMSENDIMNALNIYFDGQGIGISKQYLHGKIGSSETHINIQNHDEDTVSWINIPIKKVGDRIIRLGDIARIRNKQSTSGSWYRINGKNALHISIYPKPDINQLFFTRQIKLQLETIIQQLPQGWQLILSNDNTKEIWKEIRKIIWRTVFTLVVLTILTSLIVRNAKYLFIIVICLYVNVLISLLFYSLFNIHIQVYSMAGFIISFGLIIDNTIIMLDHLKRKKNLHVFISILAATISTIVAISVVFMLPDELRYNLMDFAVVVIINLLVSLFVALYFIPSILWYIHPESKKNKQALSKSRNIIKWNKFYSRLICVAVRYRAILFIGGVLCFGIPTFLLPAHLNGKHSLAGIYNKTLGSEFYTENIMPVLNRLLGGSFRIFYKHVFEKKHFNHPQQTALNIRFSLPNKCNTYQLEQLAIEFERFLMQFDEIDTYCTQLSNNLYGHIHVTFNTGLERSNFPELLEQLVIKKSLEKDGIDWHIYGVGRGYAQKTGINQLLKYNIGIHGYNLDRLDVLADKLTKRLIQNPRIMNAEKEGSRYYWTEKSNFDYHLVPNKFLLSHYEISPFEINTMVKRSSLITSGINTMINGKYLPIQLISWNQPGNDAWLLINQPQRQSYSQKLKVLSIIQKGKTPSSIVKEDNHYVQLVKFQYLGPQEFGEQFMKKAMIDFNNELPLGFHCKVVGQNDWSEGFTLPYALIIVVILAIFIICAILFESLQQPLAIIMIIPLSFVGAFWAFYLCRSNFDQGGYAALILLCGLSVNASIYIINTYNRIRKSGPGRNLKPIQAYLKAFNAKIIPIALTCLSTLLGLLPFVVLGNKEPFWFAFSTGTIGGLLISMLWLVLLLPIFLLPRTGFVPGR